jgi:putative hydrolases of HD superfamily
VKDLDRLEMIQQAFEYEKEHNIRLTEFYECISKMRTDLIKKWAEELFEERNKFINNL